MTEIRELKQKISELISKNDKTYKEVIKKRWDFLYKKQAEVKEIELIERLKNYPHLLKALLTYKSITRGNFQPEIAEQINFHGSEDGQKKLLEAIASDIDNFERSEERDQLPAEQPTNEELLKMLGERIATGEIKRELGQFGNYLMIENKQGLLKVDLHDGRIEPEQEEANIFLNEPVKEVKQPTATALKHWKCFDKWLTTAEPSNEALIIMLSERMRQGGISTDYDNSECCEGCNLLYSLNDKGEQVLRLEFRENELDYKDGDKWTVINTEQAIKLFKSKLTEKEKDIADAMAEAIHGKEKDHGKH